MKRTIIGLTFGLAVASGCASAPPPTQNLETSAATISAAQQAGATTVPTAALYLQLATEESDKAKALIASGGKDNMSAASNLLMRAAVDGELAVALADDAKQLGAAQAAVAQIHTFEQQTQQ